MTLSLKQSAHRMGSVERFSTEPGLFGQGLAVGQDYINFVNTAFDGQANYSALLDPYVKRYQERTGRGIQNPASFLMGGVTHRGQLASDTAAYMRATSLFVDEKYAAQLQDQFGLSSYGEAIRVINEAIENDPEFGLPKINQNDLDQQVGKMAREHKGKYELFEQSATAGGQTGLLLGEAKALMGELMFDPLASMLGMGGVTRRAGEKIASHLLRSFSFHALSNSAIETYLQARVRSFREESGIPMPYSESALMIGTAGLLGGTIGSSIEVVIPSGTRALMEKLTPKQRQVAKLILDEVNAGQIRATDDEILDLFVAINDPDLLNIRVPDEVLVAAQKLEAAAATRAVNPLKDEFAHQQSTETADLILRTDQDVRAVDTEFIELKPPPDVYGADRDYGIEFFRPEELEVDPERFQFKSAGLGDPEGVTGKLAGETEWNPDQANLLIVYEYETGRKVVVDGHQRRNLALRIKKADPKQDPILPATVYKEADGFSEDWAKARAAIKNIGEDQASIMDAAVLLRMDPSNIKAPPGHSIALKIPQHSVVYRHATGLSRLSDEAFDFIHKVELDERYAAAVGHIVDDPEKQLLILNLLTKMQNEGSVKIKTMDEAESIIHQANMADFADADGSQVDMFGAAQDLMFQERAKILSNALSAINRDKTLFKRLTQMSQRIEQIEGNSLNKLSNLEIRDSATKALQIIKTEANYAGALNDALNSSARRLRDGESLAAVSRDFIDHVRRGIDDGSIGGNAIGGARRVDELEAATRQTGDELADFEDPYLGSGVKAQGDVFAEELRAEAPSSAGAPLTIDSFGKYRTIVDPARKIIPEEDRPNLRMGDMYGILPRNAEPVESSIEGVQFYRGNDGDYYATTFNPDAGEDDVVGFISGRGDSTELHVVQEMQGRGIGSELQYLFRAEEPFAPTGGLTDAGLKRLEATYERLLSEGVFDEPIILPETSLQDLKNLIERGGSYDEVSNHPSVVAALIEMEAIPKTNELPGFGTASFEKRRKYQFGPEGARDRDLELGMANAVSRLYRTWKRQYQGKHGPVAQDRRAVIFLGPPASGKSFFAELLAKERRAMIIDSDEVKKIIPEYNEGVGSSAVHVESTGMNAKVLAKAISNGDNLIVPRTGAFKGTGEFSEEIAETMELLKNNDYTVDLISMNVSPETAFRRMMLRFIEKNRLIPPEIFRKMGNSPEKTYHNLKNRAHAYAQIENESGIGEPKRVLDESDSGQPLSDFTGRHDFTGLLRDREIQLDMAPGSTGRVVQRELENLEIAPEDLRIPIDEITVDGEGVEQVSLRYLTRSEALAEIEQETVMLDRLRGCVPA